MNSWFGLSPQAHSCSPAASYLGAVAGWSYLTACPSLTSKQSSEVSAAPQIEPTEGRQLDTPVVHCPHLLRKPGVALPQPDTATVPGDYCMLVPRARNG